MAHDRPATDQTNGMCISATSTDLLKKGANSACEGVLKDPVAEGACVELENMPCKEAVGC
jgi:hypothetical protein